MPLMDEIQGVDALMEGIRAQGRTEVQEIYQGQDKKISEIEKHFADTFAEESVQLESEMAERLAEYEKHLRETYTDERPALEAAFQAKGSALLDALARDFWSI